MPINQNPRIISAFPGTGKTYFVENCKTLKLLDSDSSNFSWESKGVRHAEWPQNYVKHIVKAVQDVDFIFVSSHAEVRDTLLCANWAFGLVYPDRNLKAEYIERFKQRGSPESFIKLMERGWDFFIDGMEEDEGCSNKHVLKSGQFISDVYGKMKRVDND